MNVATQLKRIDWILFLAPAALATLGLLAVWTVGLAQEAESFYNFKKHLGFTLSGFGLALVLSFVDYRALRALTRVLYIWGLVILAAVLIFGITVRGTKGWFALGGLTFQPVELAKVILILALAKYLDRKAHIVDWKVLVNCFILGGGYVVLTMLQPDFGSTLVLVAIVVGMVLVTRVPRRYILYGLLVALLLAGLAWGFMLKDYQKARLTTFLNPEADPFGRGYNIRQSVIAVGAGGIFGRGLGEGSQSQLRFLPEAQTDFVFAVLAEQLGFLVVLLILAAYALLVWRLMLILRAASDGFALFTVAGFFILIFVQVFLNIGMNLGILPIVGLTLPFVSLGGSAMLTNFILLGIAQSIRVRV